MSELYLLNLDSPCSTAINVHGYSTPDKPVSCGLGWYLNDDLIASTIKDSGCESTQIFSKVLSDWNEYRSTIFMCKMMTTSSKISENNIQPLTKNYAGRDWVFAHSGDINKKEIPGVFNCQLSVFEPISPNDSELIFCYFLAHLKFHNIRKISQINAEMLHEIFLKLNQYGTLNLMITDGQSVIVYQDNTGANPLYMSRIYPPNLQWSLSCDAISFDVKDHNSIYKTGLVISSQPFAANGNGNQMQNGQLIISRRSKIFWNSHYEQKTSQDEMSPETNIPGEDGNLNNANNNSHILNLKATTLSADGTPLEFVLYKVSHRTNYEYNSTIEKSSHILRLQPVDDQQQELVKTTLNLSLDCKKISYEDVFGNQTTYLDIETHYSNLQIHAESIVKVYAMPPDDFSSRERNQSIPLAWMPWQRQMMLSYLLPPELAESNLRDLTDYAMSFVERNDYNLFNTVNDINSTIFEEYKYISGTTNLHTTPYDILITREGVCQDFANFFICLARLLGIPARYQVGYIFTGQKYNNAAQGDASHAWVELYLPYIGWRGFDPTNGCLANQDHIRVARGRHYIDATPTSGTIYIGGGVETLKVNVEVEKIESIDDI